MKRSHNSVMLTPATVEPPMDSVLTHTHTHLPLRNGKSLAVDFYYAVTSSVVALRGWRSPSAVIWAIWAVVIYAVKGCAVRRVPEVCKKVIKHKPSITYCYSTSTVIMELWCVFVSASLKHISPSFMRFRPCLSMSFMQFIAPASAGFCGTANKVASLYNNMISAQAYAVPHRVCAFVFSAGNNRKSIENLPGKVFAFAHFRHLRKFIIERVRQALMKTLFGSYPSRTSWSVA
jgi:hypothetical protein